MRAWLRRLKEHWAPGGVSFDVPGEYDDMFSCRRILLLLGFWCVLWTAWQSLCIGNVSIDVAENIAWGQNFDWGYDKNPYFGAWLSYAVFRLFRESAGEYAFYFVSQFAAMLGVFAAFLLAGDIFRSRFAAFLVVPLSLLNPYFSHSSCEFNDDMLSIPLYGLTGLFFYRAVRGNTAGVWLAAGFCAGLALMTKYLAGALLLPLGLLLLFTPEGRACWKKPGIYFGAALFGLLVLPNMFWLLKHDFIAVQYAFGRAGLEEVPGWTDHIGNFFAAWGDFLVLLILPAAALLLLPRGKHSGLADFDRLFVSAAALGPMILSSLFALLTGGQVLGSWLTPYFVFAPMLLILLYRPVPALRPLKCLAALVLTAVVIAMAGTAYEFLYSRAYEKKPCNHQIYPGRRLAAILTKAWRDRFAAPWSYVIGRRKDSCFMCYYSPDHPKAFFDHDPQLSPWIDPADIRKRGAVIVWRRGREPDYLRRYPDALLLPPMKLERQVPAWFRAFASAPREDLFFAALIPPDSQSAAER